MISIPEAVLRSVWEAQRFLQPLLTADGRPVEIMDRGTLNADEGPDIHDALIRIGGTTYRGDVELHVDARSWTTHGHEQDAHYNGVILHVALRSPGHVTRTASGRIVPLLILEYTPAMLAYESPRHLLPLLRCNDRNPLVPVPVIRRWLRIVGRERLLRKTTHMEARLRELALEQRNALHEPSPIDSGESGYYPSPEPAFLRKDFASISLWEQLLYEGTMECLGFSKNRSPMLRLAQTLRLDFIRQFPIGELGLMEAMLFGASGLLPVRDAFRDEETAQYVSALRSHWEEVRRRWPRSCLHPAEWIFFRLRPVNFPTARLAVMAALLPGPFGGRGVRQFLDLARTLHPSGKELVRGMAALFEVRPSEYWQTRCLFGPACGDGGALLGRDRINDILINAVVPVFLLFGAIFGDARVRLAGLKLYAGMGHLQENSVTQRMRRELVRGRFRVSRAAEQQALLQLHNAYCLKGRCSECEIGRTLRM